MCVCVCVCVCVDGMNLKYALGWPVHVSVHSVLCQCIHKHTHILKRFEDSKPTGPKVDIAEIDLVRLTSASQQLPKGPVGVNNSLWLRTELKIRIFVAFLLHGCTVAAVHVCVHEFTGCAGLSPSFDLMALI